MNSLLAYAPKSLQHTIIPEIEKMVLAIRKKYKINIVVDVDFETRKLSLPQFNQDICKDLGVTWDVITGKRGKPNACDARFIYIYLRKLIYKEKLAMIGRDIDRDHSTIIHALQTVEDRIKVNDEAFMARLNLLIDKYVRREEMPCQQ